MSETSNVLEGFTKSPFSALGRTRDVYRMGDGPTVLVLSEIPGITPLVTSFAREVVRRGFSVAMPHLFGTDGAPPNGPRIARAIGTACVSRDFTLFATHKSSRVTRWLTELAHHEHERTGGPGVGVVGMCLTGGFALAMMVDPVVIAPVLSQPSLPVPLGKKSTASSDLGLSDEEKRQVAARAAAGVCVVGLRFTEDPMVRPERFAALRDLLGDNFVGVEIDSSAGNQWGYRHGAHSVLTEDLGTTPGSPTLEALEQVLTFFGDRLRDSSTGGE